MPDPKQALVEQVKKLRETTSKVGGTQKKESEVQAEEEKKASRR